MSIWQRRPPNKVLKRTFAPPRGENFVLWRCSRRLAPALGLMDTVSQVKARFDHLAAKIGADWPIYTAPRHDGSPHVEASGDKLSYVVTERGSEFERRIASSEDELLYWLVSDMVFSLAIHYELHHRQQGQDFRRILFARELELLERIEPRWRDRKQAERAQILEQHPFQDENGA